MGGAGSLHAWWQVGGRTQVDGRGSEASDHPSCRQKGTHLRRILQRNSPGHWRHHPPLLPLPLPHASSVSEEQERGMWGLGTGRCQGTHRGRAFPQREDSEEETDPGGDSDPGRDCDPGGDAEAQDHEEEHDPGLRQRGP